MFQFSIEPRNNPYQKIHFIGIGGTSMSGLAELMMDKGFQVSGSDREPSKYTRHLESKGLKVQYGQSAQNIKDQDLFIYTDAIGPQNPELVAAKRSGHPVINRGTFLGALMRNYQHSISVSGAHGKSTTTSMLAEILLAARQTEPTILIGGALDDMGGNCHTGREEIFLAEGCEYKGNILHYFPSIAIVLNIDLDHLDYYRDLNHIIETFEQYMENLDEQGSAILNLDDPNSKSLSAHVKGQIKCFSMTKKEADVHAEEITYDEYGYPAFTLCFADGSRQRISLSVLGDFNIYNAMAASLAARIAGIPLSTIRQGLENYRSLHRRMEEVGRFEGARVLTDYGHHPAEIRATLKAMAPHVTGRFYCVFEPHTYSRTRFLMDDFAKSFHDCDEVIITKIYGAREEDDGSVRSEELVDKINAHNDRAIYQESYQDVVSYLHGRVNPEDLILTTGCGKADVIAELLVDQG